MRDPKRIPKVLKELEKVWKKNPDLRLGQLLINCASGYPFYQLEDEYLVELFKAYDERKHYTPPKEKPRGKTRT